jgi:hypothetical protein
MSLILAALKRCKLLSYRWTFWRAFLRWAAYLLVTFLLSDDRKWTSTILKIQRVNKVFLTNPLSQGGIFEKILTQLLCQSGFYANCIRNYCWISKDLFHTGRTLLLLTAQMGPIPGFILRYNNINTIGFIGFIIYYASFQTRWVRNQGNDFPGR